MISLRKILTGTGIAIILLLLISIINSTISVIKFDSKVKTPFYFVVMGMDKTDKTALDSRTDSIMIVGVKENKVIVLPIPRDLLVKVEKNGKKINIRPVNDTEVLEDKAEYRRINSIFYLYGKQEFFNLIKKMFGITLNDYMIFDYSIFQKIGDDLAPIYINVEEKMRYDDYHQNLHIDFNEGINEMDGKKLLAYLRFRYDDYGDIGRIQRQKNAIFSIMKSAKNSGLNNLMKMMSTVIANTQNTLKLNDLMKLFSYVKNADIKFLEFPGTLSGNYVLLDNQDIDFTSAYVKNFVNPDSKVYIPRVLFVQNFETNIYNFYNLISQNIDTKKELNYSILNDFPTFLNYNSSYILIKNSAIKDSLINLLRYKFSKNFSQIREVSDEYFQMIEFLAHEGIDTTKVDAVVVMGAG